MFSSMQRAALATGAPQSRVAALCDSRGAYAGWQFRWPAYLPARDVGQPSPSPPGRPAQAPIPAMAPLALPDAAEEPTLGGSPTLAPRGSPALAPGQSPGLRPQECAPQFRQCPGCSFAVTWHHSHCCNACARGQGHGPRCDRRSVEELQPGSPGLRPKRKFDSKPVEVRHEGEAEWTRFPSIAAAARDTGVPSAAIGNLCDEQALHSGWEFRWPGAPRLERREKRPRPSIAVPDEELEMIAERLRKVPAAERRGAVAALPEETRRLLMKYLQSDAGGQGSRLQQLLARVPELLPQASLEERLQMLEGVHWLRAKHCALLQAPDIATMVEILSPVTPEQRRALLEALPEETQEALKDHLLQKQAERAAARLTEQAALADPGSGWGEGDADMLV